MYTKVLLKHFCHYTFLRGILHKSCPHFKKSVGFQAPFILYDKCVGFSIDSIFRFTLLDDFNQKENQTLPYYRRRQ